MSLARQNRESLCRPHRGTLHARRQELSQREEHRVAGIKAYRHNNTQTAREESAPRSPLSLFSAMPVGSANLSPFSPLRPHRVHNISNTAFEIFRTRCLKYYIHGKKEKGNRRCSTLPIDRMNLIVQPFISYNHCFLLQKLKYFSFIGKASWLALFLIDSI